MTSLTKEVAAKEVVAAIKGRMVSLTVLELFGTDLEELSRQLEEKAAQAPEFFRNAPLLLDFEHLDAEVGMGWFDSAYKLLIDNHFIPVGITGGSQTLEYAAKGRNMAVWPTGGKGKQAEIEEPEPDKHQEKNREQEKVKQRQKTEEPKSEQPQAVVPPSEPIHTETLVIRQPIRSGQKIYAQGGDLIVLASVSTGAEILADGHIHVYGTLRGRALAGVQGKESARIFCSDLQADLVAIAGIYVTNEDLPEDKRSRPVQIYLNKEQLRIESL